MIILRLENKRSNNEKKFSEKLILTFRLLTEGFIDICMYGYLRFFAENIYFLDFSLFPLINLLMSTRIENCNHTRFYLLNSNTLPKSNKLLLGDTLYIKFAR